MEAMIAVESLAGLDVIDMNGLGAARRGLAPSVLDGAAIIDPYGLRAAAHAG